MIKQKKFSVGISGQGRLMPRFVQLLKAECPAVIIYDRNEERDSPPSNAPIPRHPEVADVDAVFSRFGTMETAIIRSGKGHRLFNCAAEPVQTEPVALELLVKRMMHSVRELL